MSEVKNPLLGAKIEAVPKDPVEIGVDTSDGLVKKLVDNAEQSLVDTSALDNFLTISQGREQIYSLIDTMAQDSTISAIIETYVEDICEPNDRGEIIWCESSNAEVSAYITYLLDSLNINKHIINWTNKLVKYGDYYLKLFRKSDYDNDLIFGNNDQIEVEEVLDRRKLNETLWKDKGEELKEDIKISYHSPNDHYVHYVEVEPNPAEMYELTKFGKTVGYIKADSTAIVPLDQMNIYNQWYKARRDDVTIYQPTDFVHACVDDNSSRTPEEVEIFLTDLDYDNNSNANVYSVRRGQSLLYNSFRVWRLLSLLENSVAMNRINKSSILRILEVECGNMSEQGIQETLRQVKQMVEQKTSIKTNDSMKEYVNPGPIENTIYTATNGEIGKIQTQELGSAESDPKSLIDLDYYNNKLFGSLRVPKQFFAETDDGAGFNGGESLAIISSRYGKAVKRYQTYNIQAITDLINLLLIDKGLDSYINQFTIKMQPPVTKEMIDRREQANNEIGMIRDLMDVLSQYITDDNLKLEMLKVLLSSSSQDADLIKLIDDQIDANNSSETENEPKETEEEGNEEENTEENRSLSTIDLDTLSSNEEETSNGEEVIGEIESEEELPSFQDLGLENAVDIEDNA